MTRRIVHVHSFEPNCAAFSYFQVSFPLWMEKEYTKNRNDFSSRKINVFKKKIVTSKVDNRVSVEWTDNF